MRDDIDGWGAEVPSMDVFSLLAFEVRNRDGDLLFFFS